MVPMRLKLSNVPRATSAMLLSLMYSLLIIRIPLNMFGSSFRNLLWLIVSDLSPLLRPNVPLQPPDITQQYN